MTTLPLDGRDSKQRRQNFPDPDFTILCDPLLGVARYTTKWITSGCDVIAFTTVIRTIAKRANTSIAQGLHSLLHPADSSPPQIAGETTPLHCNCNIWLSLHRESITRMRTRHHDIAPLTVALNNGF